MDIDPSWPVAIPVMWQWRNSHTLFHDIFLSETMKFKSHLLCILYITLSYKGDFKNPFNNTAVPHISHSPLASSICLCKHRLLKTLSLVLLLPWQFANSYSLWLQSPSWETTLQHRLSEVWMATPLRSQPLFHLTMTFVQFVPVGFLMGSV